MGDPERLLSATSDADELERALLDSLQGARPSDHAKAAAWHGIAAQLSTVAIASALASGVPSTSAGAASAGAKVTGEIALASSGALASKALVVKVVLALALSGGALGGGFVWWHRPVHVTRPSQLAPAQVKQPLAQAEPSAPGPAIQVESPAVTGQPEAALVEPEAERARPTKRKKTELLLTESRILTLARSQLRGGDVSGARATLDRLDDQFPRGKLKQEREVLNIEVLVAQGRTDMVRKRVRAFMAAHPESPHSARLSRFLADP